MKLKALIFDLDGTIVDTSHIWHTATKKLLIAKGTNYSEALHDELNTVIHGLALDKVCAIIKDRFSWADPLEHIISEKRKIAADLYHEKISFIHGFQDFHTQVLGKSLKTGVATNADDHTLTAIKKAVKLENFFGKHIYNISCVNNICKPDPAIYLYTAKQLGIDPENCLVIEDSAHGIHAAQAAGMRCIGINTSGSYIQVKDAHHIVNSYHEIDLSKFV